MTTICTSGRRTDWAAVSHYSDTVCPSASRPEEQRTALTSDCDRALEHGRTRDGVNPEVRLTSLVRDDMERAVAQLTAMGRIPRVYVYATVGGEQEPRASFPIARSFAERQGWSVVEAIKDFYDWTAPAARFGWAAIRRSIQGGLADGVVVLSSAVISPHNDEFEKQLDWFRDRCVFIAVVTVDVEVPAVGV
ncbi:hypothetical protein [Streptomyces exfoliatus]|uniref:hypothetical protein n=1 Tax=Streptomyces exfoliatus TaxID=1905 RepID=UPI000467DCBA|nr:hypothetical protein [Streptomyces exfoliatus]